MTTPIEEISTLYESLGDEIQKWKEGTHNEQVIYQALAKIEVLVGQTGTRGAGARYQKMPPA